MTGRSRGDRYRYLDLVADALRHVSDPSALRTNPLCRLGPVESLARQRHNNSPLSRSRALRQVLLECCETVAADAKDPFASFLKLYVSGEPVAAIARKLGRSREHCSNVYRRLAVDLVTDEFMGWLETADSAPARPAVSKRAS